MWPGLVLVNIIIMSKPTSLRLRGSKRPHKYAPVVCWQERNILKSQLWKSVYLGGLFDHNFFYYFAISNCLELCLSVVCSLWYVCHCRIRRNWAGLGNTRGIYSNSDSGVLELQGIGKLLSFWKLIRLSKHKQLFVNIYYGQWQ